MSVTYQSVPRAAAPETHELLHRLGDKWSVQVLSQLGEGRCRFSAIQRANSGISQRMLTLTLRALERDGLISRTVYPTVPPRVDYELTDLGKSLVEPLLAVAGWADRNRPAIQAARQQFDFQQSRRISGWN